MSDGNVFTMGEEEAVCAEGEAPEARTAFLVEKTEAGIMVYPPKEGPLCLTHREALALAAILTHLVQS